MPGFRCECAGARMVHVGIGFFLWWGLCVATLGLIGIALFPDQRPIALRTGLCTAPFGLLEFIFVPEYWNPSHLFGKWLSIEAVSFAFGSGILAWLAAVVPFASRVTSNFNGSIFRLRYAQIGLLLLATIALTWREALGFVALPSGESSLLALVVVGEFLLGRRPDAWPFACAGSFGFGLIYASQLIALGRLVPNVVLFWSPEVREGLVLFGFPIEEMMWAALFGAVCPLATVYVNEVRFCMETVPNEK